ncbi:P-loop containing nucleoside triphosphate hydrolase protein, partial [Hysterangium stoloniferum]
TNAVAEPYYERGSNPRISHDIQLKPVSLLPDMYRALFKFGVFNAMQSQCYDAVRFLTSNTQYSPAPTGSGKTVLFELALIRMFMQKNSSDVKCVYMAPTKALCSERFRDWTSKFEPVGIKCCELTGDTVGSGKSALGEARTSSIMRPEKFDSLSRNWRDHGEILSRTQLFLIDEVHILNDPRGSTLEVVASRMKTRGKGIRFVLVSATVPNIDDIASWIGSGRSSDPATVYNFGDEFRPCKLTRIVYGYPRKNLNDFSFDKTLDYKLIPLLQQHAANKPVLVFCATRKGVIGAAEIMMKEYQKLCEGRETMPWTKPKRINVQFHDPKLQDFAICGLGVHHAGLTLDDRRTTEDLFLQKIIRVVVATSTLAVGVNLRNSLASPSSIHPNKCAAAHTVVVKGVKTWQNGGWQEYSDLDFIQMIGRAGRPQFDKEGIALILCDTDKERKYRALISGRTLLESCLHLNLAEHLNSEVSLGSITDLGTAKEWLHNSFLFQRIQKNPQHYALGKGSGQTWRNRFDELVESSIADLQQHKLHNDIRFKTKAEKPSDKVLLLIQAVLGGIPLNAPEYRTTDSQPFLEALTVFKHAVRIARKMEKNIAMVEVAIVKKSGAVLKYGMELVRSLTAKAWEDRPMVLRQIEQIGEKSIKVSYLYITAEGNRRLLEARRTIPQLLNRRPPFGTTVLAAVRDLPQYSLKITEVSVISSKGKNPVCVEIEIECRLLETPEFNTNTKGIRKNPSLGMTTVLTLTSDNEFVDFRRIPTRALREPKSFTVVASLNKPSQSIFTSISPDNYAGLTIIESYKPAVNSEEYPTPDTRPVSYDDDVLAGLEDDPTFWNVESDLSRLSDDMSRSVQTRIKADHTIFEENSQPVGGPKPSCAATNFASTLPVQPKAEKPKEVVRLSNGNYASATVDRGLPNL